MTQFRLLKQTRQMTEYSCGASALQSVLSYWGRDVDEEDLMRLLGTNAEVGTFPEDIARVARSFGFDAEAREGLTLDDVRQFTAQGHPVIALAQLWRSQKDTPASATDEWDCGHYIVVLAVDDDYVYFQDPYMRMGKGFMPSKAFQDHWHQIMGGRDLARSGELTHLAIFIRGKEPSRKPSLDEDSPVALDLGHLGSINVLNVRFPGYLLPFDFLDDLRSWIVDNEEILRPDAFVMFRKDSEGQVSAMQGGRLREGQDVVEVNALIAAMAAQAAGGAERVRSSVQAAVRAASDGDFGLAAKDLQQLAEKLPANHSEVIIMFENVWERKIPGCGAKAQWDGNQPEADACGRDSEARRGTFRSPGVI